MATLGVWPMEEESMTDALLREFLLGRLAGEERERIEGLFLTDSELRDRLLTAEQDLIEDYLEDNLNRTDKERFVTLYAQTDEQRRKLRITKSIKDWARTEGSVSQTVPASASIWSRLSRLRFKAVVPIAVAVVIAIVLVIVWLNSRMEQRQHLAVEQELAQLNSPASLREIPPQMISLELRPVTVRGVGPQTELNPRIDTPIVELRLPWIQKERYSTYQAELRRPGDNESFTIPNLQAETDAGYTIRLRVPSHIFRPGQYQIRLTGIPTDATPGPTEEYNFTVAR